MTTVFNIKKHYVGDVHAKCGERIRYRNGRGCVACQGVHNSKREHVRKILALAARRRAAAK